MWQTCRLALLLLLSPVASAELLTGVAVGCVPHPARDPPCRLQYARAGSGFLPESEGKPFPDDLWEGSRCGLVQARQVGKEGRDCQGGRVRRLPGSRSEEG